MLGGSIRLVSPKKKNNPGTPLFLTQHNSKRQEELLISYKEFGPPCAERTTFTTYSLVDKSYFAGTPAELGSPPNQSTTYTKYLIFENVQGVKQVATYRTYYVPQ